MIFFYTIVIKILNFNYLHLRHANNWKKYKDVENNGVAVEFDAEIASINKTLKLYESYF